MKDYLCKCNNCDYILIDKNPQTDAIKLEVPDDAKEMVMLGSPLGNIVTEEQAMSIAREQKIEPDLFWACPECLTDEYLTDNID